MRIGIVLSSPIGYSETFLSNKILGLQRAGVDVKVFLLSQRRGRNRSDYYWPSRTGFFLPFSIVVTFFRLLPVKAAVLRLFQLDRGDGKSVIGSLRSIIISSHILRFNDRLDWLHFEFSTFALGRENVARSIRARMATSLRGFDIGIYPREHPGCYTNLWRKVDRVHTISDDLYALALREGLSTSVDWMKITPALDMTTIGTHERPGTFKVPLRILTIGRLEWKKGLSIAIDAIADLKSRGISLRYDIIGDGNLRGELMSQVARMGLETEVHLLGKLTHAEAMKELVNHDIYIQPSLQEGFCNSLLEAQAAGLLCVASDAEGLAENVLHGRTGWIVPKNDAKALTAAIQSILLREELELLNFATQAMVRARSEFRIENQIEKFIAFYSKV